MGSYGGNSFLVSKDFPGLCEKSELESKINNAEDESQHISSNEPIKVKEEELSGKPEKEQYAEDEDVLSRAYTNYLRDEGEECQQNSSATSSESKKRSGDLLDDSMQKRHKHHTNSNDMYANLNMMKLITNRIDIQKQERSESSGKRSRDSLDSDSEWGLEGKAVSGDDSVSKKRKVWHACDNIQLKMLGPLKLPDYVKGFKYDYEHYLDIKLNKQLIEINKKLRVGGTINNCPEDEHFPSPPPIYNEMGIRVNTRVNKLQKKLSHRRQQIICELNRKNPLFLPPFEDKPAKFSRKLYIPVKQYPNYNFIGLIIGPRGHTQKRMERESGARILLRGKGSRRLKKGKQFKDRKTEAFEDDDLHVYIEAEDENSLESASEMVEKLLVPVSEDVNEHKQAQLKELAELNSEISNEALNSTNQNNVACHTYDDEKLLTSLSPLNPTNLGPASGIEYNSHQPALVSFLNCMINSKSEALPSHDTKLDSAAGALRFSHGTKLVEVIHKAKLFVGYLPLSVNTEKLIELFSPFGRLCEAVVIMDRKTGLSKGYGFIKYIDPLSAAEALVRMNGFRIDGKIITVRIAGRATLNVNTIIGPRALRFANPPSNLVSTATCPSAISHGGTKGWNNWVLLPQPNAFPWRADSMHSRPHAFAEFSERCPVGSSLIFGGPASSMEFVPFPCYQNAANSLG